MRHFDSKLDVMARLGARKRRSSSVVETGGAARTQCVHAWERAFAWLRHQGVACLADGLPPQVVDVLEEVSLQSDGADHTGLSLVGEGSYKLAAGSSTPDIDWSGNDWHGTVMLTDAGKQDWNLNDYGHAGSKVGLDGASGNFVRPNVSGEIVPTLVLVGDGLTVTACYTNSTYTFSGGVEAMATGRMG